jgi:NTP pyrophosphatase (non-canonical NTP hydrolase)
MLNVLRQAIEEYGADHQLTVAIEELSELIKEICKCKRGENNRNRIIEEMADCYIMLEQIQLIFSIRMDDIYKGIDRKVYRLRERLGGGE